MSDEGPPEPGDGADEAEAVDPVAAEDVEAEAPPADDQPVAEAPPEWVPPVELHLPPEVAEALQTAMNALMAFGRAVTPPLEAWHAQTAEEAAAADPLYLPEGLSQVSALIGDWSSQLDQLLAPFKEYIARIERENQPISDYRKALEGVFAPPPPPPAEDEDGEAEGDGETAPADEE